MSGLPARRGVQVLRLPGRVAVRDAADPSGPALQFTPAEWAEFIASVKRSPGLFPPASTGRLCFPDGPLNLPPLPRRVRRLPPPFVDEDPPI